ncbi:MAG: cytochrome C oxidase subunit II [Parachlamydiales bacterium]
MENNEAHSAIVAPSGVWWTLAGKQEKMWVTISFAWCMILFAMMPIWHFRGGQNPAGIRAKTTATEFSARVDKFVQDFKVGEEMGIPIVAPPAGADIYLQGQMWRWYPILKLKHGTEYILHISSLDINHGFSLYPVNLNFQVVPGYDYGLKIVPNKTGDFRIICNEFCGIGHHMMVGKVLVE